MAVALSPLSSADYASSAGAFSAPTRDHPEASRTGNTAENQAQQLQDSQVVSELQATDRNVRAHEAAHLAAAGGLATGGAEFTYATGPDGQRYAVGGEVNISVSKGQTPEETLARAEQIARAALAPADPSAQDLAVAAMAGQMAAQARQEIAQQQAAAYTTREPPATQTIDIFA